MKKTLLTLLIAILSAGASATSISDVWVSDLGNGQFKNPVIYADYSDPDVCKVGDAYIMTASSFNCVPGLPLLRSYDLVNWELIGYALNKLQPEDHFALPQHGGVFGHRPYGTTTKSCISIGVILILVFI